MGKNQSIIKQQFAIYKDEYPDDAVHEQLNQYYVHLNFGRCEHPRLNKAFSFLKQWRSRTIFINMNNRNLLREIQHIKYAYLTQLQLRGNQIESVEGIHRINFPKLNTLTLSYNNIVCVKEISKLRSKTHFININISHNKINEGHQLSKMQLGSLIMFNITAYSFTVFINQLNWVCKLESTKLLSLYVNQKSRIQQESAIKVIKKKHQNININF